MILSSTPLNVGGLLITVVASILEVFLLCLAGYVLAWKGILDKKTQKQMNRINVSLFTPCLLFSKVAFFLSPEKLRELWVIPIFFIIVTTVSMCVAWFLGVTFRLSRSQRSFAIAASMFMNSNSLPVALMQSLVITVHGLKWSPDDNKNAMLGRALTYLVLYSTFGMILRWSYGVRLLAQADDPLDSPIRLPEDGDAVGERRIRDLEAMLPSASTATMVDSPAAGVRSKAPSIVIDDSFTRKSSPSPSPSPPPPTVKPHDKDANLRARPDLSKGHLHRSSYFYRSFPNSPNQSKVSLPALEDTEVEEERGSVEEDGARNAEVFTRRPSVRQSSLDSNQSHYPHAGSHPTVLRAYLLHPALKLWHGFTDFMTVPLYAALLSIVVALLPTVQHTLEVHLYPIKGALESAGSCSIPVTLVVLGAYFYKEGVPGDGTSVIPTRMEGVQDAGAVSGENYGMDNRCRLPGGNSQPSAVQHCRDLFSKLNPKHKRRPAFLRPDDGGMPLPGETKTVLIAVLSRMLLTPLVLMPLVTFAAKEDWHSVFEDPVFVVSNVLLIASPPALTLAQITQAASGDAFERLISRTIFWSYCIVTPPMMILYCALSLAFVVVFAEKNGFPGKIMKQECVPIGGSPRGVDAGFRAEAGSSLESGRISFNQLMSSTITVPYGLPYVGAALLSSVLLVSVQIITVSRRRKASGIRPPQLYAENAEVAKSVHALRLNCAQRAHLNTLEYLPILYLA
ncbi:membrane transport protein-domain-containing protein [Lentinula aciculospora]|uniref:Membrane transport protein-domain-containing protein n=1 Tax=Lentinula aciculospora TaxID=153920 RepID=A0A9W9DYS2_9AGAR|nr:membrane transport protein-domain-containing protein [Lentinula aciculospora]